MSGFLNAIVGHTPENPSARIYYWIVTAVTLTIFCVLLANTIYYKKLETESTGAINTRSAKWLFWLNLLMALLAGLGFIWSLLRLFLHPSAIGAASKYISSKASTISDYLSEPYVQPIVYAPGVGLGVTSSALPAGMYRVVGSNGQKLTCMGNSCVPATE